MNTRLTGSDERKLLSPQYGFGRVEAGTDATAALTLVAAASSRLIVIGFELITSWAPDELPSAALPVPASDAAAAISALRGNPDDEFSTGP